MEMCVHMIVLTVESTLVQLQIKRKKCESEFYTLIIIQLGGNNCMDNRYLELKLLTLLNEKVFVVI